MPHLYAVNIAPDPGVEVVGASASPDGSFTVRKGDVGDRMRYEMIGFWRGALHVVHSQRLVGRTTAEAAAQRDFSLLPVRFLLHAGVAHAENPDVAITGDWPQRWTFARYQDLGVFCAYIYDQVKADPLRDQFRGMIVFAAPVTEQLLVYLQALAFADATFSTVLRPDVRAQLQEARSTVHAWLGGHTR